MAKLAIGGGKVYLFTKPGNKKLIITAHGGKTGKRFKRTGTALLHFMGRHGKSTVTDVGDVIDAMSDQSMMNEITLRGFHPYPNNDTPDYGLEKFAGKHGGGEWENYEVYEQAANNGFDIVSPRNRWFNKEVSLSYILGLKEIKGRGYTHIYCSFCRS